MPSLNTVLENHINLCAEALKLVEVKGADYNRAQQEDGDTLFNLKVSSLLGVTKTPTQGLLVRITDKLMRLVSLTSDPKANPQVKDESVKDTIKDTINYLVYLYVLYEEARQPTMDWVAHEIKHTKTMTDEDYLAEFREKKFAKS